MVSKSTILGAAGEHFVMSQLLRRGLIAALAPAGVPNADIVVTDDIGSRLCAVQVKTRNDKGSDGGWHMRAKHERIAGDAARPANGARTATCADSCPTMTASD